ncbi:MAG: GNAT family N-acetyltransferase [Deltaproteobacteria bacterium]|nr:GNAT family N-acetyltransferase [Deltaproteobacteria bacterium]
MACFFIGKSKRYRYGFIRSNGVYLNCTGNPVFDAVCAEYNCIQGLGENAVRFPELLESIRGGCNEVHLPYLDCRLFPGNELAGQTAPSGLIFKKFTANFVDLKLAGLRLDGYLARLTPGTRYQIRRSLRLYEQQGEVRIEAASDVDTAIEYFDQLVKLNLQNWRRRKLESAFESDFFVHFHKRLIKKNFHKSEIQLLKIWRKEGPIGYLYGFVWGGRVYGYQCAFNYESDKRLKPGMVCHVKAIILNAQLGHSAYDFLAGPERYKVSLATHQNEMITVICKKPSLTYWIEKKIMPRIKAALERKSAVSHRVPQAGARPKAEATDKTVYIQGRLDRPDRKGPGTKVRIRAPEPAQSMTMAGVSEVHSADGESLPLSRERASAVS